MGKKRKIVQVLSTILYNPYLEGLFKGRLYQGASKGVCVPGLNCYSCPAAIGACPLGALQNTLGTIRRGVNTYVLGTILLFSTLFGRFICGWLCPFGLLQELLHKIPGKKLNYSFRRLRFLKYAFLLVFVIAIPLYVAFEKGIGYPAFCKYICPQGTVGGLTLVANSDSLQAMIGANFYFKLFLLVLCVVASIFIYRPFCRLICPLGALYGLFNGIALVRLHIDTSRCSSCGKCARQCPVHLNPVKECNHGECVRCGECIHACGEQAIRFSTPSRR